MGLFGHLGHVVTVPEPPKIRGLKKERRGGIPRRKCGKTEEQINNTERLAFSQ